jgi:hypothetical protein
MGINRNWLQSYYATRITVFEDVCIRHIHSKTDHSHNIKLICLLMIVNDLVHHVASETPQNMCQNIEFRVMSNK